MQIAAAPRMSSFNSAHFNGGGHSATTRSSTTVTETVITRSTPKSSKLGVTIVLDTSGSMAGAKLQAALEGVRKIFGMMGDKDSFLLTTFNNQITPVIKPSGKGKVSAAEFEQALSGVQASNSTRLRDAIKVTIENLRSSTSRSKRDGKPVTRVFEVFVLTDGEDAGSTATTAEIKAMIEKPEIPNFHLMFMSIGGGVVSSEYQGLCTKPHYQFINDEDSDAAIRRAFKKVESRIEQIRIVHREHVVQHSAAGFGRQQQSFSVQREMTLLGQGRSSSHQLHHTEQRPRLTAGQQHHLHSKPASATKATEICTFFNHRDGCKFGGACRNKHDCSRCFGQGHSVFQCQMR